MEMTPSPLTLLLVNCNKTEGNSQSASLTTNQVVQSTQEIKGASATSQPQQMIGILNPDRTITLVTSLAQPQATNVQVIGNVATALKSLSTIATAQKVTNCQVFSQEAQIVTGSPGNITCKSTPVQLIHNTQTDAKKAICIPAGLLQTSQLTGKHISTPTAQTVLQPQSFQLSRSIQNSSQALLHGMTQIGGQNVTIKQQNLVQTVKSPMPVQQNILKQVPVSSANGQTVLQTVHVPLQTIQGVPGASILQTQRQPVTVNVPVHTVPQLSNMRHIAQANSHISKLPIPKRLQKPHTPYMRISPKVKEQNDDVWGINSLPNEIMLKIFAYLNHNKLGQIARVCKRWNILTKSLILWKKVDVELSCSHESQTDIAGSFVNRLPSCVSDLSLNFVYDCCAGFLYFQKLCIKLKRKCPHLERLVLHNATLTDTLPTILDVCSRHLQNIKVLIFRFCETPPDGPAKIKYNDISKIELLDVTYCNFGYFNKIRFSNMPNLKQLFLAGECVNDFWFENETSLFSQLHILDMSHTSISSRLFQAIQYNAQNTEQYFNLQELYLCSTYITDSDLSSNNSMFLHLKTICLAGCRRVTCKGIISLIKSCQSLQNVYVSQEVAESYAAHPSVVDNRYMLEIVKGREIFHSHTFSYL